MARTLKSKVSGTVELSCTGIELHFFFDLLEFDLLTSQTLALFCAVTSSILGPVHNIETH